MGDLNLIRKLVFSEHKKIFTKTENGHLVIFDSNQRFVITTDGDDYVLKTGIHGTIIFKSKRPQVIAGGIVAKLKP